MLLSLKILVTVVSLPYAISLPWKWKWPPWSQDTDKSICDSWAGLLEDGDIIFWKDECEVYWCKPALLWADVIPCQNISREEVPGDFPYKYLMKYKKNCRSCTPYETGTDGIFKQRYIPQS